MLWTNHRESRLNKQPSPAESNTTGGLATSALRLISVWTVQTLHLYVARRIDVSRFPASRTFAGILSAGVLVAFFLANVQQGVPLPVNAAFTALMALMAYGTIRSQARVRHSSAFSSALLLGVLVNTAMTLAGVNGTLIDLEAVWVMLTVLRISLETVQAR
jgi:hypothetical protein